MCAEQQIKWASARPTTAYRKTNYVCWLLGSNNVGSDSTALTITVEKEPMLSFVLFYCMQQYCSLMNKSTLFFEAFTFKVTLISLLPSRYQPYSCSIEVCTTCTSVMYDFCLALLNQSFKLNHVFNSWALVWSQWSWRKKKLTAA